MPEIAGNVIISSSVAYSATAFKRIYRASRRSWKSGENPLDLYFNVDGHGIPARNFGIEIEFDNDDDPAEISDECYCECECDDDFCNGYDCFEDAHTCFDGVEVPTAIALNEAGYISEAVVNPYHAGRGMYSMWRYETDSSVTGGEVISPILRNNREAWLSLKDVMSIIAENGGTVDGADVGGHISVNVPFRADETKSILGLFATKFEDVMYRLGANPLNCDDNGVSRHRGTGYAGTIANMVLDGRTEYVFSSGRWLRACDFDDRLEFRIFDGSLNIAVTQTFVMVATAISNFIFRDDAEDILDPLLDRPLGWHISQRRENGYTARASLSGDDWKNDTQAIREFVNILFDNEQDKERVITLFAGNDWASSRRNRTYG